MKLFINVPNGQSVPEAISNRHPVNPMLPKGEKTEYVEDHDDPNRKDFHLHAENPEIKALLHEIGMTGMIAMANTIDPNHSFTGGDSEEEWAKNVVQQAIANGSGGMGNTAVPCMEPNTPPQIIRDNNGVTGNSLMMDN